MIRRREFVYKPGEHEAEKASNSYLMSLAAFIVGLPLPVINLVGTLGYYIGNRKSSYFVRWHCLQSLLSQISIMFINSYGFWWTVSILLSDEKITNNYIAYIISAGVFNIIELIATIYSALHTRRGNHVEWWFYSDLTNLFCKQK